MNNFIMLRSALTLPVFLIFNALFALDTGVSWSVFTTGEQTYLEINMEIAAESVTFKAVDSTRLQAGVETLILLKQGEEIINFEKYILNSPITEIPKTLLDVKRFAVKSGTYQVEIVFKDIHDEKNMRLYSAPVVVNIPENSVYLSQVSLLRSLKEDNSENPFTKNGWYLEPLPFNFYDRHATILAFYGEIFQSNKSTQETYLVRYFVEQELGNGNTKLITVGKQRKKPSDLDALLVQMDIANLPTGNYALTVELRNAQNELLTERKLQFQRANPFLNIKDTEITDEVLSSQFVQKIAEDELRYCLKALAPTLDNDQAAVLKSLLEGTDLKPIRYFVFNHFVKSNANNPEIAYHEFYALAKAVDKQFKSGFRLGFESDRGRMFMKFGRPDDLIHVEDDPAAPPYEIWVYYSFPKTNQTNVKFLFYNPSLAGEDFILLHSNARGEINNPRWERTLYARNAGEQYDGDNSDDALKMQDNFNRNARRYFEDF